MVVNHLQMPLVRFSCSRVLRSAEKVYLRVWVTESGNV